MSGACVCWAVDNNLTQSLSLRSPLAVARIKGVSAGGFSLGLSWLMDYEFPDIAAISMIVVLGFVGYGVSVVLDIYALRILGAAVPSNVSWRTFAHVHEHSTQHCFVGRGHVHYNQAWL